MKLWHNDRGEGALFFATAAAMSYAGVVPGMAVGAGLALSLATYRRLVTSYPLSFKSTITRAIPSSPSLLASGSSLELSSLNSTIDATKLVVTVTFKGGLTFFGGRKLDKLRTTLMQVLVSLASLDVAMNEGS
jgi:ABC-type lipoprotein release transport system permease subunit